MNRVVLSGVLLAVTLMVASIARAEHGEEPAAGGHAAAESHEPHVSNWWSLKGEDNAHAPALGWLTLTFLTFSGGLIFALRKPLSNHLVNRSDLTRKAIEEAKSAREAAEAKARDAERKLAAIEGEMGRMKKDFEEQGRAEADRLERVAKETAARIQKDAEDTINAERERATQLLRAEAAKLALELAEERLKAAVTPSDDARLQKALISHLSKQ